MINDLLLLSGNDIPFEQANLVIHQPTIKEIAYIGEEAFYTGCEFLNFSKDSLEEQDRNNLGNLTNFEIIMSIMKEKNITVQKNKVYVQMVLFLIFPDYSISLGDNIILTKEEQQFVIDKNNYEDFLKILNEMFCLKGEKEKDYNPVGDTAKRIANKLKNRHKKIAEDQPDKYKIAILSKYVSILATGQKKDMNSLLNYTVYQLFDEFKRFELKIHYDIYIQAKLAGAKDLKEVDDWMKDIHS